jgi:hypothetical protein
MLFKKVVKHIGQEISHFLEILQRIGMFLEIYQAIREKHLYCLRKALDKINSDARSIKYYMIYIHNPLIYFLNSFNYPEDYICHKIMTKFQKKGLLCNWNIITLKHKNLLSTQ